MDFALDWVAHRCLENGSFVTTCAALFYAHLAYRTSMLALAQAKQAELTILRIQAQSALIDAPQAQVSLAITCQVYRANWASHARKQPMTLGKSGGIFERSPSDAVQQQGVQLIQQLDAYIKLVDQMDLLGLEALLQKAKATALGIQALAGSLEPPT